MSGSACKKILVVRHNNIYFERFLIESDVRCLLSHAVISRLNNSQVMTDEMMMEQDYCVSRYHIDSKNHVPGIV